MTICRTATDRSKPDRVSILLALAGMGLGVAAFGQPAHGQDGQLRLIDPVDAALSTPRATPNESTADEDDTEGAPGQGSGDDLLAGPRVRAEVIPGAGQSFGTDTDPLMRGARVPLRTFLEAVRELAEPATPDGMRLDRATAALLAARARAHQQEVAAYWRSVSDQTRAIRRMAGLGEENRTAAQRAGGDSASRARVADEIDRLQRELRIANAESPPESVRRDAQPDPSVMKPEPSVTEQEMKDDAMAPDATVPEAMTSDAMAGDTMAGGAMSENMPEAMIAIDPRVSNARAAALDQLAQLRRQAPSDVALRGEVWERLNDAQRERVVEIIEERFRREYERRTGVRLARGGDGDGDGDTMVEGELTREAVMRGDFDDRLFDERTRAAIDRLSGVPRERALNRARERAVRAVFENQREDRFERPEPPTIDEVLGGGWLEREAEPVTGGG